MQRTNEQLVRVYLYSQRDEWVIGMINVQGYGGTEGRTDGQRDVQNKKQNVFYKIILATYL